MNKIGIAGPVSLRLLRGLEQESSLPVGYEHPPMALLVNALLARGYKVTVFTTSVGLEAPVVYQAADLTVCVARRQKRAAREFYFSTRRELVSLTRQYPVDILNAHWSYEFALAALDTGLPVLVTLRDHAPTILRQTRSGYWFLRWLINGLVVKNAQYLSTNSNYLFEKLSQRHQRKTMVTQNFFSSELTEMHRAYRGRRRVIVSISNGFSRTKNIDSAIRAFGFVRQSFPDAKYILIGHEMEAGGLAQKFAVRESLAAGIEFLGRRPHNEVLEHLRQASVLLHPSLEESFGMSVLESMVVGTPVIGGIRSGNIPALLDNGMVGILCDVKNPRTIAEAVIGLLQDTDKARSIAEAATEFAGTHFSEDAAVSKYLDYYRYILENCAHR